MATTAICINPVAKTIQTRQLHSDLKELQHIIGGYVEVIALSAKDIMYVCEEPRASAATFRVGTCVFRGTAIVVGVNDAGNDITPALTLQDIARVVTFGLF